VTGKGAIRVAAAWASDDHGVKMMDSSEILWRDLGEGCIDRIHCDRE
jgi:hypothetical protein